MVRAVRGSRSADVLTTQNSSIPGAMEPRLVRLRRRSLVSVNYKKSNPSELIANIQASLVLVNISRSQWLNTVSHLEININLCVIIQMLG